jgi:hypothetical protein
MPRRWVDLETGPGTAGEVSEPAAPFAQGAPRCPGAGWTWRQDPGPREKCRSRFCRIVATVDTDHAREALRRWLALGELPRPGSDSVAHALVAAAEEQGLAGLLLTTVADDPHWPAEARDRLRSRARWLLARGERQLDLLSRTVALLAGRGLRSLPLKGAALLGSAYASPVDRPMADVDLLVLDDWTGAYRTLRERGYEEAGRADHAAALVDPEGAGVLELHWSVTSCPTLFPLPPGLWERSRSASGVRRPCVEDLLVQLALHASFQHGLVLSLVQWLDFRRVLEAAPAPAERLLWEIAKGARAERALDMALEAAALVVGAPHVARAPGLPSTMPLSFVTPSVPRLAWRRWQAATGRRARLVRETLLPRVPGAPSGPWAAAGQGVRRLRAVLPHLRRYPWGA